MRLLFFFSIDQIWEVKTLSVKKAGHLSFIIQIKIITVSDDVTLNDVIVTSVPLWINIDGGGGERYSTDV